MYLSASNSATCNN